MLYLEDYLEMIEHLPQELRDRFTEMRELDLTVQNTVDSLDKKARYVFMQCKRNELQEDGFETEFSALRSEYYKALEDADEKVAIATQIHDLVDRYLVRLDSELFKFKCELEADNNGITEILEKRSLENDNNSTATALLNVMGPNHKENRFFGSMPPIVPTNNNHLQVLPVPASSLGGVTLPAVMTSTNKDNRYRKSEKRRDSATSLPAGPEKRAHLANNNLNQSGTSSLTIVRPITPSLGTHAVLNATANTVSSPATATPVAYNFQQLGAGGSASNAIAAAASQAIVATQQMQQGRRTASLKASYEAIHGAGGGPTEFWINRDIASAATAAAAQTVLQNTPSNTGKKNKKKLQTNISGVTSTTASTTSASSLPLGVSSLSVDSSDLIPPSTAVGASTSVTVSSLIGSALNSNNSTVTSAVAALAATNRSNSVTSTTTQSSTLTLSDNGVTAEPPTDADWSYDPNEPRYCTCNQVSYGDMVACDNEACPYEWFHYQCVGITQPPKGKWYCPKCTASRRRRKN